MSGFGNSVPSPYRDWPAFAPIVEAMSGVYEMKRQDDLPPVVSPVGALGDIGAALYTTIGILAGVRDHDRTGRPAYVDVAMLDAVMAMTDIVTNYWSMGVDGGDSGSVINHVFGPPTAGSSCRWPASTSSAPCSAHRTSGVDHRRAFCHPYGWVQHLDEVIRPAVEKWAAGRSRREVCEVLVEAGIAAGPCVRAEELVADPHVTARQMLVGIKRTDGVDQPVLIPGTRRGSSTGATVVTDGSHGSESTRTRSCAMSSD